ncbi:MAG TPA: G8 domain-containing protein [Bacteroidia bacterium]|nr:G8 domain-containing protein [Bacteroidia bacterium]
MKFKFKIMLFVLALLVANINNSIGQVTLVDPNGDGGFENGSTFASNGWIVASGVANNQWFVGSGAVPHTGSNCAYISETGNGSTYTYNFTSASTVYFYRDITFPAGNPRIVLKLNYNVGGEPFFDRGFVCYTDPANTPVVNDYMSSTPPAYGTAVSGNFNSWSSTSGVWSVTTTYLLPASFAGTTKRLIFGWQNDGNNVGSNGPIAFDNISVVAGPSINATPNVTGGLWSNPATWVNGDYPGPGDDVTIPDGVTVTLDAVQSVKNLTIGNGTSGVLNFSTAFNALTVSGNITVNNGGLFNGFTQTQSPTAGGVTVNVAGNINLNAGGVMTMGHASALLHMNGTTPQSINGPGVFLDGLVRELRISNNSSVAINTPIKVTQTFGHFGGVLNSGNRCC